MLRLTRQVRLAVNLAPDGQEMSAPSNSFGGYPSLTGLGQYFVIDLSVSGHADQTTGFLCNIKAIDAIVRRAAPGITRDVFTKAQRKRELHGFDLPMTLFETLRETFATEVPQARLEEVRLHFTPTLSSSCLASEHPMIRLSQRFEFSASHRLHRPEFSDEQNLKTFGKCSNPHGHGHNYELQVTLAGKADKSGLLIDVPTMERVVATTVLDRFDHKNLNVEVTEFKEVIPTVENIAKVIYGLLKPKFEGGEARLASVTVWETPKTWCEYSEG
jgi:6-pyruvoyltetrahydropterin/6-carboxytetrahydropterin synthase